MDAHQVYEQFFAGLASTKWYEAIAVVAGIASVWFSKKENILVFPVGLINTMLYVYLSLDAHLPGEALVNLYYTVMSIYGWIIWSRVDAAHHHVVNIRFSSAKNLMLQMVFFAGSFLLIFLALQLAQRSFAPGAIPWADALASASAFTAMWLMAKKKVESWIWWIVTNIASIPLYFVKGYVFTSVYYFILLILAFAGWAEWRRKALAVSTSSS